MLFKWGDDFCCNIQEIDKQHKKLFETGNKVYELASLDDNYDHYDEIMEILDELRQYTIYHFNYEEKLLSDNGYDKLDTHKIEHYFFTKKLQKIGKQDIDNFQKESIMEILTFIADWITNHILKSDHEYKDFLISKGVV